MHHTSTPCERGSGSKGFTVNNTEKVKSNIAGKGNKEDLTAEEVEKYIREEYSDCFCDKLGKNDRKRCGPAELIISQEEVDPHHGSLAWDVPAHYLKEARGLVDDLLNAGIILCL